MRRNQAKNLQYVFRPTGNSRTITPEHGKPRLVPEVAIVSRRSVGQIESYSGVAEVEGHGYFYLHEAAFECDGKEPAILLTREVNSYDAGDNLVRQRIAPQSTQGICSPEFRGGPVLSKVHGDAVFAAAPGSYQGYLES